MRTDKNWEKETRNELVERRHSRTGEKEETMYMQKVGDGERIKEGKTTRTKNTEAEIRVSGKKQVGIQRGRKKKVIEDINNHIKMNIIKGQGGYYRNKHKNKEVHQWIETAEQKILGKMITKNQKRN